MTKKAHICSRAKYVNKLGRVCQQQPSNFPTVWTVNRPNLADNRDNWGQKFKAHIEDEVKKNPKLISLKKSRHTSQHKGA